MDSLIQRELNDALESLARDSKDEAAWLSLYRILRPYVLTICARWLGRSDGLAEDACQEVFMKLLRFAPLDKLAGSGNLYAYVRMICRSVSSDILRRNKDFEALDEGTVASPPGRREDSSDAQLLLDQLRGGLSSDEAKLLKMLLLGYTIDEIAGRYGLKYSAAGVRIHRLREKLYSLSGESRKPM